MEYINQLINELMAWIHSISNDQVATFWLLLTAFGCGLLGKFLEQIGKKKKFEQMEAKFKAIIDAVAELRGLLNEKPEPKEEDDSEDDIEDMDYFARDIGNVRWNNLERKLSFEVLGDGNCWYAAEAKYDERSKLIWLRTEGEDDIRYRALNYAKNWKKLNDYFHIA